MEYGAGKYRYRSVDDWGRGPGGRVPGGVVAGVNVDSQDRIYAFVRTTPAVQVFDRDGNLVTSWGDGEFFPRPHGIWISPDDMIFLTDCRRHTVSKHTPEGELLETWGTPGEAGNDDAHFNGPNDAVVAPSGEMYVGDNVNARVVKFSPNGRVIGSWGEPGDGPGQFNHVHNVRIDSRGRVLAADRENSRIQIFENNGTYITEWPMAKSNGIFMARDGLIYATEEEKRKVNLMTEDGECLSRWGKVGKEPGQFKGFVHGICVDSKGSVYVCEILQPDKLQKFMRV